jgi:outer membrane protein, multidrug efflux system
VKRRVLLIAMMVQLAACAPATKYVKPEVAVPAEWSSEYPWRKGNPSDATAKGSWWEMFGNPELDRLEVAALDRNPGVQIAANRLEQAKAIATVATAGLYPQLDLTAGAVRAKTSQNRPAASPLFAPVSMTQNDFTLGLGVSYEADFSGRVRSTIESAEASSQQAKSDYENVRLLLGAELASDYYALRALDAEIEVVRRSIELQREALEFVRNRHELGAATGLDLAQQQAQLDTTITQIDILENQRAKFAHAIATLTGTPAPAFRIAAQALTGAPPRVPVALPSDVLERRPDVASAERAMAAANAQIGVAQSAFYPTVMLSPMVGLESAALASLANASSLLWSLGVGTVQTLFDAGRNRANLAFSEAGYKATVNGYRQAVLTAMQEVEDGISGSAILERAAMNTGHAIDSSGHVLELASARYEGGIGTHLDVITAQQGLLANQRQLVQITGQRFQMAVFLVKASGGVW